MSRTWAQLVAHSTELATKEDFDLAEEWSTAQPEEVPRSVQMPSPGGRITDPFAVVPDQPTATNQTAQRPIPEGMVAAAAPPPSEGGEDCQGVGEETRKCNTDSCPTGSRVGG